MRAWLQDKNFAEILHAVLVILMLLSFLLITQQSSKTIYQIGFVLLIASTFVQIVFGNVPPTANFTQSMKLLVIGLAIIATVFILGILLAPYLANLGR
ncbi:hypothetical protein GF339_09485 [candidate division KSB3 bacterium]|uniref:Uncharacterized protein n=1 Tax=candidate division KSB3 bacterium TaxID=2044937 RepID=A0A9D5JV35_9BACT|nr:hypothetical protein [candidate division KSB3 bacterium]MBD3324804.1 hypothetical protein [candidate division KSB3 bacterium]